MENAGTIPFLAYKHFASRLFFPEVQWDSNAAKVHILQTEVGNAETIHFLIFFLLFQSESLRTSCIKDIGQVGLDTSCWWCLYDISWWLCQWSDIVFDLKSGCGTSSAWRVLPGLVQATPGPALPHIYGARYGGAEELQHQRQVSLWRFTVCDCLLNTVLIW